MSHRNYMIKAAQLENHRFWLWTQLILFRSLWAESRPTSSTHLALQLDVKALSPRDCWKYNKPTQIRSNALPQTCRKRWRTFHREFYERQTPETSKSTSMSFQTGHCKMRAESNMDGKIMWSRVMTISEKQTRPAVTTKSWRGAVSRNPAQAGWTQRSPGCGQNRTLVLILQMIGNPWKFILRKVIKFWGFYCCCLFSWKDLKKINQMKVFTERRTQVSLLFIFSSPPFPLGGTKTQNQNSLKPSLFQSYCRMTPVNMWCDGNISKIVFIANC